MPNIQAVQYKTLSHHALYFILHSAPPTRHPRNKVFRKADFVLTYPQPSCVSKISRELNPRRPQKPKTDTLTPALLLLTCPLASTSVHADDDREAAYHDRMDYLIAELRRSMTTRTMYPMKHTRLSNEFSPVMANIAMSHLPPTRRPLAQ